MPITNALLIFSHCETGLRRNERRQRLIYKLNKLYRKNKKLLNVQVDFLTFLWGGNEGRKSLDEKNDCLPLTLSYIIFILII